LRKKPGRCRPLLGGSIDSSWSGSFLIGRVPRGWGGWPLGTHADRPRRSPRGVQIEASGCAVAGVQNRALLQPRHRLATAIRRAGPRGRRGWDWQAASRAAWRFVRARLQDLWASVRGWGKDERARRFFKDPQGDPVMTAALCLKAATGFITKGSRLGSRFLMALPRGEIRRLGSGARGLITRERQGIFRLMVVRAMLFLSGVGLVVEEFRAWGDDCRLPQGHDGISRHWHEGVRKSCTAASKTHYLFAAMPSPLLVARTSGTVAGFV